MSNLDLSLPGSVPEMARYANRPMTLAPFAIYNLLDTRTEPTNLVSTSNSLCPRNDYVHFRPTPTITALKHLISYHLTTTVNDNFDPNYFLVVADEDWESQGVLMVTMADEDGKPDAFVVKAEDSGIVLVNLQIGNTDWYEARENYQVSDTSQETDESGNFHAPPTLVRCSELMQKNATGTFPDGAANKKPATGFYIPIYGIPGIDPEDLIQALEPFYTQKAPKDRVCRFQGYLTPTTDLASQAMESRHIEACRSNIWLCKMYFLVADSVEFKKEGLVLCGVEEKRIKRVVCRQGVTVPEFCKIAQGERGWDEG
ncbi:hypothetical protein E4T48_05080 [Aureobasidium sp. EXF-10727]|nr:hypothetical protein E4T48_05080 [Aureobasidium sp. EXF-10727]KAI4724428.1 hypothetical protein E4T49_07835 [Aureobasidium sp. EXF-10728]